MHDWDAEILLQELHHTSGLPAAALDVDAIRLWMRAVKSFDVCVERLD